MRLDLLGCLHRDPYGRLNSGRVVHLITYPAGARCVVSEGAKRGVWWRLLLVLCFGFLGLGCPNNGGS